MGDSGYILGYLLFFSFCAGGLVASAVSYYIFKHDDKEDE